MERDFYFFGFFFELLFFNFSSSSLLFSSSVSSFLYCTSASAASRFSLRQLISVVMMNPINEVAEAITEPINAPEFWAAGAVGSFPGWMVSGVLGISEGSLVGDGLIEALRFKFNANTQTTSVEIMNKARKILLKILMATAAPIFANYGFFLKRTSTRFLEQSL